MMNDSLLEAQLELSIMPPDPVPGALTRIETMLFLHTDPDH